jgi:hypothetical protein
MANAENVQVSSKSNWLLWSFATVGFLGLLAVIYIAMMLGGSFSGREPARVVGATASESYAVGEIHVLSGTGLVAIDINEASDSGGIKSYSGGDQRNILLLDKVSGESHRLLPDNKKQIIDASYFPSKVDGYSDAVEKATAAASAVTAGDAPATYYVIEIEEITDDGKSVSLLVGTLATRKQSVVMKGIDGIDSKWMLSPTELGLIVREKQTLYFRIVDIPTLNIVKSVKVDID